MSAYIALIFGALIRLVFNCFRQVLHLSVIVAQGHDIVGITKARNVNVRTNLNPWVALQGLTKNPAGNVVEEGRRECSPGMSADITLVFGCGGVVINYLKINKRHAYPVKLQFAYADTRKGDIVRTFSTRYMGR